MELLAATVTYWILYAAPTLIVVSIPFLLSYTNYWWILLLYFIWIWKDKETSEREGRQSKWVKSWICWKYVASYFSLRIIKEEKSELDPKKNYLLCCFPHAIIPIGAITAFGSTNGDYEKLFPSHKPLICTVDKQFIVPFMRELLLSLGFISVSAKAIMHNLTSSAGGKAVCIFVGGLAEALYTKPSNYKLLLKNRKGFVKMALKTGTPLVPVITFNEVDVYDQLHVPLFSKIQGAIRKIVLFPGILLNGKYLLCPRKVPLTVVVGQPIYVEKNEAPSTEDLNKFHELFIHNLTELFENHKSKYIQNASNIHLEIV